MRCREFELARATTVALGLSRSAGRADREGGKPKLADMGIMAIDVG